jgi:uncharacterized protein YecT (DUF1311 family)
MKMVVAILGVLFFALRFAAPQQAPTPKKILTPDQLQYQQETKKIDAERSRLRAIAKQALDDETAQAQEPECPNAQSNREWQICLGDEGTTTEKNFKAFADAIRATLGLDRPAPPGAGKAPPVPGPAGVELTPQQLVDEFDKTEGLWETYRDAECTAAFHQFGGGTGGPGAELECRERMIRQRMHDLDSVYNVLMFH